MNCLFRSTRFALDFAAPVEGASAALNDSHFLRSIPSSAAHQVTSIDAYWCVVTLTSVRSKNSQAQIFLAKSGGLFKVHEVLSGWWLVVGIVRLQWEFISVGKSFLATAPLSISLLLLLTCFVSYGFDRFDAPSSFPSHYWSSMQCFCFFCCFLWSDFRCCFSDCWWLELSTLHQIDPSRNRRWLGSWAIASSKFWQNKIPTCRDICILRASLIERAVKVK